MVTRYSAGAGLITAARTLALQKGEILVTGGETIPFLYNPSAYSVTKSAKWSSEGSSEGEDAGRHTFKSVESSEVEFTLFFDTYEYKSDVRRHTDKLFKLVKIDPNKKRPPLCRFHWGKDPGGNSEFEAFVENVKVTYSLFLMDGTPVRAEATINLKEVSTGKVGQNPTTQGTYGDKVHIVKPGETLSLIAHMYYGSSTEWRILADANRLTNPLDIRPGQYLEIVPLEY
jgi:nucleoid-associated protein YgaU